MDQDLDFSRSSIVWENSIQVGNLNVSLTEIFKLRKLLTDERKARLDEVVSHRSLHVIPVLENIYDRGNVSAVMRSSEAFGFLAMYLVDKPGARFKAANRVTKGAEKWIDVRQHQSAAGAIGDLRAKGYQVWATDLNTEHSIDTLNWNKPIAIVLGNEKDGVSPEMKNLCDGTFRIPMLGFSQSFNISVAAALIFYHAYLKCRNHTLSDSEHNQVLANYYLRCFDNPEALLTNLI